MHLKYGENAFAANGLRASITDIPTEVLIDILSRLSVKSIFVCGSLCKYLHSILTSPIFARLHSSRASTGLLLVQPSSTGHEPSLHLVEFDRDRHCRLCSNNRSCASSDVRCASQKHKDHVNMKLSTRFTLPRFKYHPDVSVVNSCNGLLCLWYSRSESHTCLPRGLIAICNPVTGEYSVIPLPDKFPFSYVRVLGLGFCRATCQYKVLISADDSFLVYLGYESPTYLIFTVGSGSWRKVENVPEEYDIAKYAIEEACVREDVWPLNDKITYQKPDTLVSSDGKGDTRYFKIRWLLSDIDKAIFHVPSFLPLKDILGDRVKVYNVRSRLAKNNGRGRKIEPLFLVEEDAGLRELQLLILMALVRSVEQDIPLTS